MDLQVIETLEKQANHEFYAEYSYRALSYWCESKVLNGFAEFFMLQAGEEKEHASKILEHLIERGVSPKLLPIAAPQLEFETIEQVVLKAFDLERANTQGIYKAYEAAVAAKDYPVQILMEWFIKEQVEEEDWSDALLTKVRQVGCGGGLCCLDRHVVKDFRSE